MAAVKVKMSASDIGTLTKNLIGQSKSCSKCKNTFEINKTNFRLVTETRANTPYLYFKEICRGCENSYTKEFNKSYLTKEKRKEINEKKRSEYCPDKNRDLCLRYKYGISKSDYDRLFVLQSGLCAICFRPSTTIGRGGNLEKLAVDHCHETGKIRGLLCQKCNRGLGLFNDDIPRIESAIAYIKRSLLWRTA